jgi:hypothetical protein
MVSQLLRLVGPVAVGHYRGGKLAAGEVDEGAHEGGGGGGGARGSRLREAARRGRVQFWEVDERLRDARDGVLRRQSWRLGN